MSGVRGGGDRAVGRRGLVRWLPAAVAVAVVAAVASVLAITGGGGGGSPDSSTAATAWALPRLDGHGTVRLADLRGRPVVVTFFATWCTACRGELPGFARISGELRGRVTFVGVDSSETAGSEAALTFARELGIGGWPLAADVGGAQDSGLHDNLVDNRSMPITAFYDAAGRRLHVRTGAFNEDDLRQAIRLYAGGGV